MKNRLDKDVANHHRFTFGEFVLDIDRGALLKDGLDIPLRPKSLAVLHCLLEHHGLLVSKNQLMDTVWADRIVTEGSLTQCLIEIRKVLGDDSRDLIRTVPRRGFILDVPVTVYQSSRNPQSPDSHGVLPGKVETWRQWAAILSLVVLALIGNWWIIGRQHVAPDPASPVHAAPASTSIAILPFADMTPTQDHEYLCDGLAEEILNLLAQTSRLTVIARTSSFSFKGQHVDINTIGRKLHVANILEGSVRKDGRLIRVTAQLVRVSNGAHIWSKTYDYALDQVFALQSDVAAKVVKMLKIKLLHRLPAPRETRPDVYSLYLQGQYFLNRNGKDNLQKARSALEQAVAIDPDYAPAWVRLGVVYSVQARAEPRSQAHGYALALQATKKALVIDPDMASAWASLAYLKRLYEWDWQGAQAAIDKALQLEPNNPNVLGVAASLANTFGKQAEAIDGFERAIKLDPLSMPALRALGSLYTDHGDFEKAIDTFHRLALLNPLYPTIQQDISMLYLLKNEPERALRELDKNPPTPAYDFAKTTAWCSLGNEAQSQAMIKQLLQTSARQYPRRMAMVYAWCGEPDAAFDWLEKAFRQHDAILAFILGNPLLNNLHDDPRFPIFLKKMGLLQAWKDIPSAST